MYIVWALYHGGGGMPWPMLADLMNIITIHIIRLASYHNLTSTHTAIKNAKYNDAPYLHDRCIKFSGPHTHVIDSFMKFHVIS